jgi:Putative prokaryotic signal transducing protein
MSERVRIGQAANPAEATLLRSLFDAHGIAVAINGENHAAMLGGLGGAFISLDISVAAADAERARELLAEFHAAAPTAEAATDDEDDDNNHDDLTLRLERRKRIGIAVMLGVFVSFGTAHLSAGAFKRALAIAILEIVAIRELVVHPGPWPGAAMFAGAILFDLIDAIRIINITFARRIPAARVRK